MEYGIRLEEAIRLARVRLEHWIGAGNRETCFEIYLLDGILDNVETATAVEASMLLSIPPEQSKREWCKNCKIAVRL